MYLQIVKYTHKINNFMNYSSSNFYNLSWVERLSCLSRPCQLLKPKGRNPRLFLVHLLNPQKPVAELVGNQIFFSGNKYETSPQIIV